MDQLKSLDFVAFGNPLSEWGVALGIAAVIALSFGLVQRLLLRRLSARVQHTPTRIDDALLSMLRSTRLWLVAIIALSIGAQYLNLSPKAARLLGGAATIATFLQFGLWAGAMLEFWLSRSRAHSLANNASAATHLSALGFMARLVLWTVMTLLVLDNLGINITTLVAGLGIGGVAVALAVQNILGDLFASLSIIVDKPFVIGDFIVVESFAGTVENVGLKTTRLRSVDGELIIFSNSDLLKSRLRNFKRMYERRVVFAFGVPFETPVDKLERIPPLVKAIVERQNKVRFERAHFQKINAGSLDFETVYWVTDPDYNLYMDVQQAINLALLREFRSARIELANTRTVLMERDSGEGSDTSGRGTPGLQSDRAPAPHGPQ